MNHPRITPSQPPPVRTQFGLALVPFGPAGYDPLWLQPKPTIRSWQAARAIGLTELRLQFNVGIGADGPMTPVSPLPGDWNPSLFRVFIEPAFTAGVRINTNYVTGTPAAHHDLAFHEASGRRLAREFGQMVVAYSLGNEWGYDAQQWETQNPGRDYLEEVFGPQCVAFVRGVRSVNPDAWITGSDAESAETQMKYMRYADRIQDETGLVLFNEHGGHPYGEVADGGLDYATIEGANGKIGFVDVVKADAHHRPLGFSEIDNQQFKSALLRLEKSGPAARAIASDDELRSLIEFTRKVAARGDITQLIYGSEGFFFERGARPDNGLPCNSFYLPQPKVSWAGELFAAEFARVNGPVDPIRTTMPAGRKRSAGK